ncbi:MAG: hypothetical protein NW203_12460 [Hyphomonadaceae bacterium]|nr:hypothetical protein [Hyphomonadaceae bacterium]
MIRVAFWAVACLMSAAAAWAEDGRWLRAETRHFVLYSNELPQRVREAAEQLEQFDHLLRLVTQQPPPAEAQKLEVYLLATQPQLAIVQPGLGESVAGFYAARTEMVAAFSVAGRRFDVDGQEILFHEYAHHFLYQNFNFPYPGWFIEGFAEYMQTAEVSATRLSWGRPTTIRGSWLLNGGDQLPLNQVLRRVSIDRGDDVGYFYAQSWLLTHFMLSVPENRAPLQNYFQRIANAEPADEALYAALGMDENAIERRLRQYVRGRVTFTTLNLGQPLVTEVAISRLPRSADDLLLPMARLRLGVSDDVAEDLVARIAAIAARYPGDAYAVRAHAYALALYGDAAAARARIAPVLTADPNDANAHYITGLAWLRDARAGDAAARLEARRAFVRAFRLDDAHVPTLYRYVETFTDLNQPLSARDLDVLLRAHDLAPQVFEIGANAAAQLAAARRYREAIATLTPFAQDPHGGPRAERARAMIAAYAMGQGMQNEAAQAAPAAP